MEVKLCKKHRHTLERIFAEPVSGTIPWVDIEALFKAIGAKITQGRGSRVRVNFGKFLSVYHRPHPRTETVKGAIKSVRYDLERAGVTPDDEDQ